MWGATENRIVKGGLKTISIHAPVWGATNYKEAKKDLYTISIHAPVWGATPVAVGLAMAMRISIHAPVWGATTPSRGGIFGMAYFNSRSRVGSDSSCYNTSIKFSLFQFTLPCGERQT